MKTYQKEYIFVGIVLFVPCLFNFSLVECLAAVSIFFTFQHQQVAARLQEKQDVSNPTVECHKKLTQYYLLKEVLWVVFFICSGAYSGIVGSFIFISYPYWRMYINKK